MWNPAANMIRSFVDSCLICGFMWTPNMIRSFVDSCLICGLMWTPAPNMIRSFVDSCEIRLLIYFVHLWTHVDPFRLNVDSMWTRFPNMIRSFVDPLPVWTFKILKGWMSGAVHMDPRQHCTGSPLFQMGFTLSSSLFRSSFSSLRAQHLGRQLSGALISRQGNSSSMMLFSPNCILDGILMDFCLAVGPRYACWSLWPWPCCGPSGLFVTFVSWAFISSTSLLSSFCQEHAAESHLIQRGPNTMLPWGPCGLAPSCCLLKA